MLVSAILLAAGESTRMGTPKPLLPWEGATLLEYQVRQLRASRCAEVVVVLGHEAERLRPLLGPAEEWAEAARGHGGEGPALLKVVLNPSYWQGKTTSIGAGVEALSVEATAALILAVDQPRPAWLLDRLIEEHERAWAAITVPVQAGHRGHPPIFAASLFPELRQLSEERQGLREVLARHAAEVHLAAVDTPLVHVNLNRPEDYDAALALFRSGDR